VPGTGSATFASVQRPLPIVSPVGRSRERAFGGYARIAIAASLWGTWSLFFRPAERMQRIAPALEAFIVFAVILIAVAPGAWRDRPAARRSGGAWFLIVVIGAGDALNALLFFKAMQTTSLAIAVLSHYLAPVLIATGAPFVLGERLRAGTVLALGVALGGLVLLLDPWHAETGGAAAGAVLGAGSAVFYATNILITKRIQHLFSPREILAWHMPVALVVLALCMPAGGFAIALLPLLLVAAAALLIGALAGVLFLSGLFRVDASRAAVLTLLEPTVAVFIGALVWHEQLGLVGLFGAALVLGGAAAVMRK
jgi:drug/metabolite transporter (DMT)-like permease